MPLLEPGRVVGSCNDHAGVLQSHLRRRPRSLHCLGSVAPGTHTTALNQYNTSSNKYSMNTSLCLTLSVSPSLAHPLWLTLSGSPSLAHPLCLTLSDLTKGTQDKDFSYSFSDSLSLSVSLVLVVTMKSKELKTKIYSHAHSLSHPL